MKVDNHKWGSGLYVKVQYYWIAGIPAVERQPLDDDGLNVHITKTLIIQGPNWRTPGESLV